MHSEYFDEHLIELLKNNGYIIRTMEHNYSCNGEIVTDDFVLMTHKIRKCIKDV